MTSNKLKRLPVSASIIQHFLGAGIKHYKINNPLPDDARIIGIIGDYQAMPMYHFLITSEGWEEVKDGDPIPLVEGLSFIDLRSPDDYSRNA